MKKEKKIVVIGDSHAWGCTIEIANLVGKSCEVTDMVMPGARNKTISSVTDKEISNLSKEDIVIVWSGANDIKLNKTNIGHMHIRNFIHSHANTNILIMTDPHRYNLKESSCYDKEIHTYSCKLKKMLKLMKHSDVLETVSIRSDFTKHRLHLNRNGRERMAKLIGKRITSRKNVQQPLPIPLQWRDNCINTAVEEEERCIVTNIL
jgi:hypothetical protein